MDIDEYDLSSLSYGLRVLVSVHLFGKRAPKSASTEKKSSRVCKYYPEKESVMVNAEELLKLTPRASKLVALTLWLSDFKWLYGDCVTGFSTNVHFGYDEMYGAQKLTTPIPITLKSDVFTNTVTVGTKIKKKKVKIVSIEVPMNNKKYIFVKSRI